MRSSEFWQRIIPFHPCNALLGYMRLPKNVGIKLGAARLTVTMASGGGEFRAGADRRDAVIPEHPAFRDHVPMRIKNHGTTVLKLIVVHADRVGEHGVNGIVTGTRREPLHQPRAALEAVELQPKRRWIRLAIFPEYRVHESGARAR